MNHLKVLGSDIHQTAVNHGWWEEGEKRNVGETMMLMVSEIGEAFEEWRDGKPELYYKDGKPEGIAVELADCIIRILDYAHQNGFDMDEAMRVKMAYNETRPYRHGGKKA